MTNSSARPALWREWGYSLILLVAYVAIFHAWMFCDRTGVLISGSMAFLILSGLHWRAAREHYFKNRWDAFLHAVVLADILLEMILIQEHRDLAFYWCAVGFAVVVGGYRWKLIRQ